MAMIDVDTSPDACARPAFVPLEPGIYDLEITNDVVPVNSSNNKLGLKVEYKEVESNKILSDWVTLDPKMKWYLNQFIASAGLDLVDGQFDSAELKGLVVKAVVEQKPWTNQKGETQLGNNIKEYVYE